MDAAGGKEDSNAPAGCLVTFVIVLVALLMIGWLSGDDDSSSSSADGTPSADELEFGAFDVCTEFVKDRLRAPSTAKFRNFYEDDGEVVISGGPTIYTVTSTVDSENGFGAMLRNSFVCQVEHVSGTQWRLADLSIG